MKKMIICLFIFLISFYGFAQISVNIVKEAVTSFIHHVQMLEHMAEQVSQANQMVQYQIQSLESLSQGDFEGIVEAVNYQAQSIGEFSNIVNDLDYLKEFEVLKQLLDSNDFNAFALDVQCLSDSVYASSDFLSKTLDLIENTEYRIERQQKIQSLSQNTNSIVGQLQLQQQSIALLQGELSDIVTASAALNNAIGTQEKAEKLKKEFDEKTANQVLDGDNSKMEEIFNLDVTEKEYYDLIFGINLVHDDE